MSGIGLVGLGSYLPGEPIAAADLVDAADSLGRSPLFRAPDRRHHVRPAQRAAAMIERAARPMLERLQVDPEEIDVLVTNVLLPDHPITGSGAEAADLLGMSPEWVLDLHNGGCGSFAYMLRIVDALVAAGEARTALICNVQNTGGQVFSQPVLSGEPPSAVPGDGCGVAYVAQGAGSPVLGVHTRNSPPYSADMGLDLADGRKYWEPGGSELNIKFNEQRTKDIIERGNRLVPEAVRTLCVRIGVDVTDIDALVTNQPSRLFLRNWHEDLGIAPERHLDTFDRFGNLYGAGVPITLEHAVREQRLRPDDLVVCAGFAHAGDFASAAAFRYHPSTVATSVTDPVRTDPVPAVSAVGTP